MNEIAGLGNHNTALYWEQDPRTGRRWNLDPFDQISRSNYAILNNSPIWCNDPDGDYSKFDAWWRNMLYGNGGKIRYTKSRGEWGYQKKNPKGIAVWADGFKAKQAEKWLENEEATNLEGLVWGSMYHEPQYHHQDAPEGVDPNATMDFHDRVKEAFNMASPAFIAGAPQLNVTTSQAINQGSRAVLKNGYYEVNGFKFSQMYYNKLWNTGRGLLH